MEWWIWALILLNYLGIYLIGRRDGYKQRIKEQYESAVGGVFQQGAKYAGPATTLSRATDAREGNIQKPGLGSAQPLSGEGTGD